MINCGLNPKNARPAYALPRLWYSILKLQKSSKDLVLTARLRLGLPLERHDIKLLPGMPDHGGIATPP
jgi:hypothetical protein